FCLRTRPPELGPGRRTARRACGGGDSLRFDGPRTRLPRKAEFGPGAGEPDLSADVVLLRLVDSDFPVAALPARSGAGAAAVPRQPVGAAGDWHVARHISNRNPH